MKRLYSTLIAIAACVVFAEPALADPGNTWDKVYSSGRFKVLSDFNNEAVLDKETGRVWERSPDSTNQNWFDALDHCYELEVGGRLGWRLPTIEELASLGALPADHPFDNVQTDSYWSATTWAKNTLQVWLVGFPIGNVFHNDKDIFNFQNPAWCVRGGQGIDGVQ